MSRRARFARMGTYMLSQLQPLADSRMVGHIAGLGLLASIDLIDPRPNAGAPAYPLVVGRRVADAARRRGILPIAMADQIALRPPLIINRARIDEMVDGLRAAVREAKEVRYSRGNPPRSRAGPRHYAS